VRLTGVFGGEIFRGVSTFKPLGLDRRLFDSKLALAIERRGSSDPTANDDRVTAAARKEIPWGIFGSIATCRSQLSFRTPYLDQRLVALAYRMPAALQGSARPFVSAVKRFDVGLAAIPTDLGFLGNGGSLVALPRRALAEATFKLEYLRSDGIPRWARAVAPAFDKLSARVGVGGAHKYLRYRHWFRQQLAGYVRDSLASASVDESGIWDKAFIRNLADEHISGRANYLAEIHAVLTLEAVKRCLLGVPSASTAHPPRLAAA
jgi:asparagine synthase (glutamine-hydrolysing)